MSVYGVIFTTTLRVQEKLYISTDGRIGHKLLGVPSLLLRTTGAKSGEIRTNALIYAPDGERWLVVPSKGGAPKAPAWLFNLRAKPDVEIQVGRKRFPATATEVKRGDPDFDRLWKLVNANNGNRYDAYQKLTTRQIPVVVLTPA
jgi:deazaflavin-dependent oxidoreductase (nitroreductase family)